MKILELKLVANWSFFKQIYNILNIEKENRELQVRGLQNIIFLNDILKLGIVWIVHATREALWR